MIKKTLLELLMDELDMWPDHTAAIYQNENGTIYHCRKDGKIVGAIYGFPLCKNWYAAQVNRAKWEEAKNAATQRLLLD